MTSASPSFISLGAVLVGSDAEKLSTSTQKGQVAMLVARVAGVVELRGGIAGVDRWHFIALKGSAQQGVSHTTTTLSSFVVSIRKKAKRPWHVAFCHKHKSEAGDVARCG